MGEVKLEETTSLENAEATIISVFERSSGQISAEAEEAAQKTGHRSQGRLYPSLERKSVNAQTVRLTSTATLSSPLTALLHARRDQDFDIERRVHEFFAAPIAQGAFC
jgi:hypothetical protein